MLRSTSRTEVLTGSPRLTIARAAEPASPPPAAQPESAPSAPSSLWDAGQVLTQLERILASNAFDASTRNRAFLRYVVNETLTGRADHIKGYTVAQEVFQRDVDFDPQLDPVVRIEASRLRRSLERYYLTAGRQDQMRIDLPKGGYVPKFEINGLDGDQVPSAGSDRTVAGMESGGRFVIVRPFENLSAIPPQEAVATGLADELIESLAVYDGLKVIAESDTKPAKPMCSSRQTYVLQGSTRRAGTRLRVSAQLLDYFDARYLWVQTFDRTVRAKNVWALQEEIAGAIAQAVAGPTGALATLALHA